MIKYALRCHAEHEFESWFRDSASYDGLSKASLIACPDCGSTQVSKALMAPSVRTSRKRASPPPDAASQPALAGLPASMPVFDEKLQKMRAVLKEFRDRLLENSTNVGEAFAEEARKIHDGVADAKSIHGIASREEVHSLLDDGIEILPLPVFPDDAN